MTEPQSIQDEKVTALLKAAVIDREETRADLEKQLDGMHDRITSVEQSVTDNTRITSSVREDTRELLDIIKSVKGGFKVMGWLGAALKWAGGIAAAFAGIYAFVRNIKGG